MALLLTLLLLGAPDADKLATEFFGADATRRRAILEELAPVDAIDAAEAARWRTLLLKLAAKGRKLKKSGTNFLLDEKEKRGKYIVGGGSGKGGLLIGLHGGGEGAGDAGEAAGTFGPIASKFKCVGIFPEVLEKTERGWTTSGTEEFVLELIEAAKRTWKIDPDRVYIVGHSMGGFGSWTLGAHHADLFAGAGPYAGAPIPYTVDGGPRSKVIGIVEGIIPSFFHLPLHVYQSLDDVQVPPEPNVFANAEILRWKAEYGGYERYKYVEVDGRGHGAPPGGHVEGFAWLYQFARDPRPKRILWQPVLPWKRMFYWLWWDEPIARVLVDARITGQNEIRLDLAGASPAGFRILLDERLVDLDQPVRVVDPIDKVLFEGRVPRTRSTMLMTAGERYDSECVFPARIDLR